jgi:uncharacterized protein (UPF0147 family)
MPKITKKQMLCQELAVEIISEADYLLEDQTIPKNVLIVIRNIKNKLDNKLCFLEISTILYELEETINSVNAAESRSIVWSLISKLENLKERMK